MPTLPFAATHTCRRCGRDVDRARNQFTLAYSPAYDDLLTGNLCSDCFGLVRDLLEDPTTDVVHDGDGV